MVSDVNKANKLGMAGVDALPVRFWADRQTPTNRNLIGVYRARYVQLNAIKQDWSARDRWLTASGLRIAQMVTAYTMTQSLKVPYQ